MGNLNLINLKCQKSKFIKTYLIVIVMSGTLFSLLNPLLAMEIEQQQLVEMPPRTDFVFLSDRLQQLEQLSCPLINVRFQKLMEIARRLEESASFKGECEPEALNHLTQTLKQLDQLKEDFDKKRQSLGSSNVSNSLPSSLDEAQIKLLSDTTQTVFQSLNDLLTKSCQRKVIDTWSFLELMADTTISVGPLLLLSDRYTLTGVWASFGGQVLKVLINYFRPQNVDMSKFDNRQKFLKAACAFYVLDRQLDIVFNQMEKDLSLLQREIETSKKKIQMIQQIIDRQQKKSIDERRLQSYENAFSDLEQIESFMHQLASEVLLVKNSGLSDSVTCQYFQESQNLINFRRAWERLDRHLVHHWHKHPFLVFWYRNAAITKNMVDFKATDRSTAPLRCVEVIESQLLLAQKLVRELKEGLVRERRDELERHQVHLTPKPGEVWHLNDVLAAWNDRLTKLKSHYEELLAFNSDGKAIAISEVLNSYFYVEKTLFQDPSFVDWSSGTQLRQMLVSNNETSLSYSWLSYQTQEALKLSLRFMSVWDYFNQSKHNLSQSHGISYNHLSAEGCSRLRHLKDTMRLIEARIQSADLFCSHRAFGGIIKRDPLRFKKTYDFCFRTPKEGKEGLLRFKEGNWVRHCLRQTRVDWGQDAADLGMDEGGGICGAPFLGGTWNLSRLKQWLEVLMEIFGELKVGATECLSGKN
ncbi:MAG: hypothetical protein NZ480_02130 [Bdellovibrionaceae bacterium]|nr:hypothetical protein [Pseudobdellovibrionaceae bacterium]MDW8189665.1 hypothetical protein [Pseudobdellovibrionaceae bacterium]